AVQLHTYRPVRMSGDSAAADSARLASTPVPRPITARSPVEAPAGTSLTLNGNKTVAVDFGSSQDAFLRQSLDLAVSGSLAPGVEVTGVLSDRNTALSATGTTQDLQSLDRVLLELRAPQGEAALGDVTLALERGEFGRVTRRLQGIRGQLAGAGFQGVAAAASARGEYHVLQFFGVEGRQGPYLLTDRNGGAGVSVVAGSEAVTLDGVRLTRGESADYSMDYERARLTFSNRRPITSASRITVEYQFTVNRFRRNLAAAGLSWEHGPLYAFTTVLNEGDDGGRPLDLTFDATDRLVLETAGDSATSAIGSGVSAGPGDYDRIDGGPTSYYAFAGPDSGDFTIRFTRVGDGQGDYADSAVVAGRVTHRFVGAGNGAFRLGRSLPLPDSHQLWSLASGLRQGALVMELEGAVSRRDLNTFSERDDADNLGHAGSARAGLEGELPWAWSGRGGLRAQARGVATRFEPFTQLERPFANEDWGLPLGSDLEHQTRFELGGFLRPRLGGELRGSVGRLATPGGFHSLRRWVEWSHDAVITTRALWERADGVEEGRLFEDGGRERRRAEIGVRLPWLEPRLRGEWDERRSPSDSGRVGDRFRELSAELGSTRAQSWRAVAGYALRRDASATAAGFADRQEARTLRLALETPTDAPLGAALTFQRRAVEPLIGSARTRSDLASARLRASDPARGLAGLLSLEVTSEGENRRERVLSFVGADQGAYDSLGNFVGTGDYELVLSVRPDLVRVARAATSARVTWQFGESESWRGSRAELSFESEARRRADFLAGDALLSPGAALGDGNLSNGRVLQRIETELAPGAPTGGLRLRLERRVSGDRSFENFSQTLDERVASSRWRARPSAAVSSEVEARWRRQSADQNVGLGAGFRRRLLEYGGLAQLVFNPDARLRASGTVEGTWVRPETATGPPVEFTRTLKLGPDLGVAVGPAGRVELGFRRAFEAGPPAISLLPSADPAGAARWEGTARVDYRVRESTTLGASFTMRDRPPQRPQFNGRAELRAFF
ncbi:MAG TPA: hypothetical protein VEY91_08870, partial [Candidatus Limnocylindria bacterium]|nr:hypothetical protein [Candidatus Limnocylindria bacterium]